MSLKKLKVRPRKNPSANPCAVELATMLGCWASTGDLYSTAACADATKALHKCMRALPIRNKPQRPTINYHLARLSKILR